METEIFPRGAGVARVVRFRTKGIDDNHRGVERRVAADRRRFSYTAYLHERCHLGKHGNEPS